MTLRLRGGSLIASVRSHKSPAWSPAQSTISSRPMWPSSMPTPTSPWARAAMAMQVRQPRAGFDTAADRDPRSRGRRRSSARNRQRGIRKRQQRREPGEIRSCGERNPQHAAQRRFERPRRRGGRSPRHLEQRGGCQASPAAYSHASARACWGCNAGACRGCNASRTSHAQPIVNCLVFHHSERRRPVFEDRERHLRREPHHPPHA